jgi:hypothetical protein
MEIFKYCIPTILKVLAMGGWGRGDGSDVQKYETLAQHLTDE